MIIYGIIWGYRKGLWGMESGPSRITFYQVEVPYSTARVYKFVFCLSGIIWSMERGSSRIALYTYPVEIGDVR